MWEPVGTAPENVWISTALVGEWGENVCFWRRVDGEVEWVDRHGRTTITHGSFAPPTHWRHLPRLQQAFPETIQHYQCAACNQWWSISGGPEKVDGLCCPVCHHVQGPSEPCPECGGARKTYAVRVCPACEVQVAPSGGAVEHQSAPLDDATVLSLADWYDANRAQGVKPIPAMRDAMKRTFRAVVELPPGMDAVRTSCPKCEGRIDEPQEDRPEPSEALEAFERTYKAFKRLINGNLHPDGIEPMRDDLHTIRRAILQAPEAVRRLVPDGYVLVPEEDYQAHTKMARRFVAALPSDLRPERGSSLEPFVAAMHDAIAAAPTPTEGERFVISDGKMRSIRFRHEQCRKAFIANQMNPQIGFEDWCLCHADRGELLTEVERLRAASSALTASGGAADE